MSFLTLIQIFFSISFGQFPLSEGPAGTWSVCQNRSGQPLQTQFQSESIGRFRERQGSRSQGEMAADYLAGGAALSNCNNLNAQTRSLDRAQAVVTADLMSRVQELTLDAQRRSVDRIKQLQNCTSTERYMSSECQSIRENVVPVLNDRLSEMRIARAISMISENGGCAASVYQNFDRNNQNLFQCLATNRITHDTPFTSRIFGGTERVRNMDSLSATERSKIVEFFKRAAPELRANPQGLQQIRRQSGQDYERLLMDYPILNYVSTPSFSLIHEDVRAGLSRLEQNANREMEFTRSREYINQGVYAEGAVAQAIQEVPAHLRGNYCEMTNRLKANIGNNARMRNFGLIGLGLATMGVGGVGFAAIGGASVEGAGAILAMQNYQSAIRACQGSADSRSSTCNLERLQSARDDLPTPTQGALFLTGGAVDFLGALRRVSLGTEVASRVGPDIGSSAAVMAAAGNTERRGVAAAATSRSAADTRAAFQGMNRSEDVMRGLDRTENGRTLRQALTPEQWRRLTQAATDGNVEETRTFATLVNELDQTNLQAYIAGIREKTSLPIGTLNREAMNDLAGAYSQQIGSANRVGAPVPSLNTETIANLRRIEGLQNWNEFQQLPLDRIQSVAPIGRTADNPQGPIGTGFLRVERGSMDGQEVFIKTSSAHDGTSANTVVHEARMARALNEIGLGPRLHGVTTQTIEGRNHYVLIADFVEGQEISMRSVPTGVRITQSMIDDIRSAGISMDRAGIDAADLQFRLTPSGRAVLIDPEDFRFATPRNTTSAQQAEVLARQLEVRMLMQRR